MSGYRVFDNEEVQFQTRKRAGQMSAMVVTAVVLTVVGLGLGLVGTVPIAFVVLLMVTFWLAAVGWIVQRMHKLREVMWCLKISEEQVVGYDYLRKPTTLPWESIRGLHWLDNSLRLEGDAEQAIVIPHLYTDFHRISHQLLQHALWNGTPIFVDGHDWLKVDVYDLYPFLEPVLPGEDK